MNMLFFTYKLHACVQSLQPDERINEWTIGLYELASLCCLTYTFKNDHCKIFNPFVWSIKNMQCTALKCNVITSVLTSCSNMEEKEFVSWLLWLRDYITGKNQILSSKPCHSWNPWQNQALIRSTDPMLWDDIRWAKMLTVNIFTFDCTLARLHIQ